MTMLSIKSATIETRWWLPAAALAGVALAGAGGAAVDAGAVSAYVACSLAAGAVYLGAVVAVLGREPRRGDLAVIVVTALALRAVALWPEPNLSTDAYRYVWDGRVQAAGFSPYLYVPADARLAHLRDQTIYPNINQKERAVTIYPPAAELLFRLADAVGGLLPGGGMSGVRAVMLAIDLTTIGALVMLLGALGMVRERVLIYAWHPLPVWEFVAQSHIDAAATLAIVLGLVAAARGRQWWTGGIFAVAALVKYFPVVLLPALWRRFEWRLPVAFVATAALLYAPFIGDAGLGVLGFLGEHLDNEGYGAGWGFHPVWLLRDFKIADPPGRLYVAAALLLLALLSIHALFARGVDEIRFDRLLLLGGAFVFLTSPHYPWYFGFLVALLVAAPRAWAFAMTLAASLLYMPRPPGGVTWTELYLAVYWLPLAVGLGAVILRRWHGRRLGY